jgi:hypothetical protein
VLVSDDTGALEVARRIQQGTKLGTDLTHIIRAHGAGGVCTVTILYMMSIHRVMTTAESYLWLVLDSHGEGRLPKPILEALNRFQKVVGIWQKVCKELARRNRKRGHTRIKLALRDLAPLHTVCGLHRCRLIR